MVHTLKWPGVCVIKQAIFKYELLKVKELMEVGWKMDVHMCILNTHSLQQLMRKMSLVRGNIMHKEGANCDHSTKDLLIVASRITRGIAIVKIGGQVRTASRLIELLATLV
jgi:hypothetical protein